MRHAPFNDEHPEPARLDRAAELSGLPPTRVRRYLRIGLVRASLDDQGLPRFTATDIARLRKIRRLTDDVGLSPGSMEIVLALLDEIDALRLALAGPGAAESPSSIVVMARSPRAGEKR